MTALPASPRRSGSVRQLLARSLDPVDMLVEGIVAVLIVLTFTLRAWSAVAHAAPGQGGAVPLGSLWADALGAAVAWGLIDSVMYLMLCLLGRSRQRHVRHALRDITVEEDGIVVLADELDAVLAPLTDEETRGAIYRALHRRAHQPAPLTTGLTCEDIVGACVVVGVAVTSALPIVIPLWLFPNSPVLAVRLSNLVAFRLLFGMGYRWGRYAGTSPRKTGLTLMLIGVGIVAIAIPLGG